MIEILGGLLLVAVVAMLAMFLWLGLALLFGVAHGVRHKQLGTPPWEPEDER